MKKLQLIVLCCLLTFTWTSNSQNMTNTELEKIFYVVSDTLQGNPGNWRLLIEETLLICVTDEANNRMRIISPITEVENVSVEEKETLLKANFHSALDARYAISDGYVWSAFIHPLKELNKNQVIDAISQVYVAAMTYGTTYNSSGLSFPGNTSEEEVKKKEKTIKLQKRNKT